VVEGRGQLSEPQRQQVLRRWQVLAPYLQDGVPLTRAAGEAGVPLRTARRRLHRYRESGLEGLARTPRPATGRKGDPRLVRVIEEMALRKPRSSLAEITRRAAEHAAAAGIPPVSYTTVRQIVSALVRLAKEQGLSLTGPDGLLKQLTNRSWKQLSRKR